MGINEVKVPACLRGLGYSLDHTTSDEFDGTELDPTKWWDYAPHWRGRKEFIYSHENVAVENGMLELTAKAIPLETMAYEDRCDGVLPYTMPIIKSKQQVTYGYFECRSQGTAAEVRNAFWLYDPLSGENSGKKRRPGSHSEEIDIYEFIGRYQDPQPARNAICAHVHRFETPYVEGVVNAQKTVLPDEGGLLEVEWAPSEAFHTYGLLWTEKELVWTVDDQEYHRRQNDFFHTPLHILFNCELACWRSARIDTLDPTTLPAVHRVDYFRRWAPKSITTG